MSKKNKSVISSSDDENMSVISRSGPSDYATTSTDGADKKKKPKSNVATGRSETKSKPRSAEVPSKNAKLTSKSKADALRGSKNKTKSRENHGSKKGKSKNKSSEGHRSKNKSSDGHRSKSKSKDKHRHSKHSKGSHKTEAKDKPDKEKIRSKIRKIEATKGATAVSSEKTIAKAGYEVESAKLFQSDYSQVMRAKKNGKSGLVVKVVNLSECSPRTRANLVENSVRILRFVSAAGDKQKGPISPLFIAVYDVYLVSSCRLFIFMAECAGSRSLYDLVKSSKTPSQGEIRDWFKEIVTGVDELQRIGVAHRAVKMQHILFDAAGKPKLIGWGKSVFFYEPNKKRIQLQRKERRVRRNYHLPPEAFVRSYDPSKADIWSVGVALVAMCTKRYPFNVRDKKTKFSSQWREFVKNHELNTNVRNLCHKTFIIDPKRRVSTTDILAEKYFTVAVDKLALITCKADTAEMREDSRVGGMSIIDLANGPSSGVKSIKEKTANDSVDPPAEEEQVDWAEEVKADPSGENENATGFEGGNVGEEENLAPAEQEEESQMAEKNAPEEGEAEAQPEDGGEAAEAADATEEEGEQTEEQPEVGEE